MDQVTEDGTPFLENIALGFSGGGYRASAFSLGILSYFHYLEIEDVVTGELKPLLYNVKGISSVSGGTITAAVYTDYTTKGENFDDFYKFLYTFLDEDKLLDQALQKMEDGKIWKESGKKQTLINSFALTYKELLTQSLFRDLMDKNSHLEDFCFNASELSFGLSFRFQNRGVFGNHHFNNNVLKNAKREFALADIIAASSCFPLGFEPMILPDDFLSMDHALCKELKQLPEFEKGVGILDGGIIDNQGIGSIMLADDRRSEPYDLIMNCDVASYMMLPWQQSEIKHYNNQSISDIIKKTGKWLLKNGITYLLLIAGILLTILGIGDYFDKFTKLFMYLGGMLTLLVTILLLYNLWIKIAQLLIKNKIVQLIPAFFIGKLIHFDELKLNLLRRMVEERVSSGTKMVNEIFLKQIRRLNYNLFYSKDKLEGRRATALIYSLTKAQYENNASDEFDSKNNKTSTIAPPSTLIYNTARIASETETTLWFTKKDKEVERLKNLVACGQFTACYILLKFIQENHSANTTSRKEKVVQLLENHWREFNENPYWLWGKLDEKIREKMK